MKTQACSDEILSVLKISTEHAQTSNTARLNLRPNEHNIYSKGLGILGRLHPTFPLQEQGGGGTLLLINVTKLGKSH